MSSIDLGPTVLNLAGLPVPEHVQGRPFLGPDTPAAREYVFGARDRMDERYDVIRMVRNERYKYLRNYEPLKTYYQYMNTPEKGATMRELRRVHAAGELPPAAEALFAPTKPVEELYDTEVDPHEIRNLANDPEYAEVLERLRAEHLEWVTRTRDVGLVAEPILAAREKATGRARYFALRNDEELAARVAAAAVLASSGGRSLPKMVEALADDDAAVRYWGAVGIGNVGRDAAGSLDSVKPLLEDESPAVRVQAARALCRLGKPSAALPVLADVLANGEQWERLQAAIVLDEIDELAKPVAAAMHAGLKPRRDLYANGKYVVRVLNRALNQLEGTSRTVP